MLPQLYCDFRVKNRHPHERRRHKVQIASEILVAHVRKENYRRVDSMAMGDAIIAHTQMAVDVETGDRIGRPYGLAELDI